MRFRLFVCISLVVQTAAAEEAILPVFDLPPADTFNAMVERPLFSPVRRGDPAAAATLASTVQAAPAGGIRLIGIAGDETGRAVVLLRDEKNGGQFRVLAGESFGGWRVGRLVDGMIELTAGGQTHRLPPGELLPVIP